MSTFTRHQVAIINQVSKYHSNTVGVYYTQATNRWLAEFRIKGEPNKHLGFFDTELEAAQACTDYHEKFYQEVLTQIKKKKDDE